MPQARLQSTPLLPLLMLTGLAVAVAGCAGETGKSVAEAAGMATTAAEPKPFVRETRPSDPTYIPIGTTVQVNPLCEGDTPRPAFVPQGQAARFLYRPDGRKPNEDCKPRAEFKKIEAELEAKRSANEAAGNVAKTLGSTPAPKPAAIPTN
ncbi:MULTISPECIES: hypothetical protein [Hyphomicrobiales]|jgi:hypothetical protein|uniref:Lipoprotein n=1 Tax=Bosea massiliensis TaxID=151419 RepID=A0ABW0P6S4_9HYPH|nr:MULTISPECIES: hypothetical protein [Hyphomicrobiales]